jgi:hypothetical protein
MPKCLRVCASAGSVLLFLGLLGCGGGPSSINGKVSYKGVPVTGGNISFDFGADKRISAMIDAKGNYSVQTPHTGKATVAIETESLKNTGNLAPLPGGGVADKEKITTGLPSGGSANYVKIPAKYADAKSSNLTADIKSGTNPKNFDLTD